MQPNLEIIEVFVDMFSLDLSKVSIDTSFVRGGILIEEIENMIMN